MFDFEPVQRSLMVGLFLLTQRNHAIPVKIIGAFLLDQAGIEALLAGLQFDLFHVGL